MYIKWERMEEDI